jgi:non-specific protein-tyrosine kinase
MSSVISRRAVLAALPLAMSLPPLAAASAVPPISHRRVAVNGITLHVAEQGTGPLVILCHGWPECWHSWHHQMGALAAAGYRAVAPDQRGFGDSDAPAEIDQYTIGHTVGDMVDLVGALGETQAVIVGHDWGAPVAWTAAQLRPDIFRAVAALSVPFVWRGPKPPLQALKDAGITRYYWQYFQTPGVAEAELEADPELSVRAILYGRDVTLMLKPDCGFLGENLPLKPRPAWLSEEDISTVVAAYRHSGFRGGLNWYRNIDRNWGISGPWDGLPVRQQALFITGTEDILLRNNPRMHAAIDKMTEIVPGLRRTLYIDGAGHWIQRERPREVSDALVAFLKAV